MEGCSKTLIVVISTGLAASAMEVRADYGGSAQTALKCAQGHEQLQAAAVLELPAPQLLACGLSRQKAAYIADLAQRFHAGTLKTRTIVGGNTVTVLKNMCAVPSRTYTDLTQYACLTVEGSENVVGCAAMGDEELYEKLTAVKGIGVLLMPDLDQSNHSTAGALI